MKTKGKKFLLNKESFMALLKGAEQNKVEMSTNQVPAGEFVIFRAGDYPQGSYTNTDLDEMVASFDQDEKAAIIIGHSSDYKGRTRIPAFGVIGGIKRVGDELIAFGTKFNRKLAEWIKEGFYPQRSVEIGRDAAGKLKLMALGMLGAAPPAVSGLPAMDETLDEIALTFAEEVKDLKAIEFAGKKIDFEMLMSAAADDTYKDVEEHCAMFLAQFEQLLKDSEATRDDYASLIYELNNDLFQCAGLHQAFEEKAQSMRESLASKAKEMAKKLFTQKPTKETPDMEAQVKQEYDQKIAALTAQVAEFTQKESDRKADEEKAKAEKADTTLKGEIKEFCEAQKKEGRYTAADDEKKMPEQLFAFAKAGGNWKEFVLSRGKVVPLGTHITDTEHAKPADGSQNERMKDAQKYITEHKEEFSKVSHEVAMSDVLRRIATGQIKL